MDDVPPRSPAAVPPPADRTPFRVQRRARSGRERLAAAPWTASALLGVVALALGAAHAPARRAALEAALAADDPTRSAGQVSQVATVGVDAALAWVLVGVVVVLVLLPRAPRHRGAAIALAVVGVVQLGSLLVVPGLLSAPGWGEHALVRWALFAQGVFTVAGLVALRRGPRR